MCGICAVAFADPHRQESLDRLRRMNVMLTHRGPDDEGYLIRPGGALAMRRLSIIDVEGGHQPILNETGDIGVVLNGEIYNHVELRKKLTALGHEFRTRSDTEVLVHLYEEYGEDLCRHLYGMFAFALWDARERTLLFARDRIGLKPLFYALDDERLILASEIKALLASGGVDREVDLHGLSDYLTFGYVNAPSSIFRSVRKLRPGEMGVYRQGKLSIRPYWELEFQGEFLVKTQAELLDDLDGLLYEAVRVRLMSDVPFGALLSGGIDSSLVVAYMSRIQEEPVRTFSIGFDEDDYNELPRAREIARALNAEHHELVIRPDVMRVLPEIVRQFDEPFGDPSAIPTYCVCALAREHVKMCLSGDGGDESFGGYRRYLRAGDALAYDYVPPTLKRQAGRLSRALPLGVRGRDRLRWISFDALDRYVDGMSLIHDELRNELVRREVTQGLDYSSSRLARQLAEDAGAGDFLSELAYIDLKTYLPDNNLQKVDRLSMLHSLEVRAPFTDVKLIEYALHIRSTQKLSKRQTKLLLRRLAARYLPDSVVTGPKMGFSVPVDRWLRHDLQDLLYDHLRGGSVRIREYVDGAAIEKLLRLHERGHPGAWRPVWTLLMLEMWAREYLSGDLTASGTPPLRMAVR